MLIICKSCKKLIDTEKHDFCPKCGANFNYSDNLNGDTKVEDYKEYERNRDIERSYPQNHNHNAQKANTKLETKRRIRNNVNKQDGKKNGCIGCFVALIFIFIAGGSLIVPELDAVFEAFGGDFSNPVEEDTGYKPALVTTFDYISSYPYIDFEAIEDNFIEKIAVGYGETAYRENINVTCDEVSVAPDAEVPEGYTPLSFHLIIEKLSGSDNVFYFDVGTKLYADGEECMDVFSYTLDEISADTIDEPGWYDGYATFMVPNEAETFSLVWYNNTEIIIKNDGYTEGNDNYGYDEYGQPLDETVRAGFYEEVYIGDTVFMCTDFKETFIDFMPASDGNMYVSFGLSLLNLGDGTEYVSSFVDCYADGEACTAIYFSDDPLFMPFDLEPYELVEGYACFEVPEDTKIFEIHYDNAVIEIENTLR